MTALEDATIALALETSSASLHEAAGRVGALPSSIKPVSHNTRVCGRAFPVRSPAGDNLWLHRAIYAASAGDVLVVDVGEGAEFGYWGAVMTIAAQGRGIAGLVINGGARDARQIVELNFPVFSDRLCIRGTGKNRNGAGSLGAPIVIGDVAVTSGDMVFGDGDGVVVLPGSAASAITAAALLRDKQEAEIVRRLRGGETTMQIYGLQEPVKA